MSQIASVLEKIFVHKDKPPVFRLFIYAAYLVPPIAVALLTWHEMTNTELVWSSTEITRPHDAYQTAAGNNAHWSPTTGYQSAFLAEFNKSYFGRPSRFEVFSPDMERASLTVILQNNASSRPILINSISVVAMLEDKKPFDWRQLDVSAELAIESTAAMDVLTFINHGPGPMLDFRAELATEQGFPLMPFVPQDPITTQEITYLWAEQADYSGPYLDDGGYLPELLYRVVEDGETIPDEASIIDCTPADPVDNRCLRVVKKRYEQITAKARLRLLTDVQTASSIEVEYRFKDLKGEPSSDKQTVALPTPIYWYQGSGRLLSELPQDVPDFAYGWGDESAAYVMSSGSGELVFDQAIAFAKNLFGVAVKGPKGVSLIKAEIPIDATNIPECGFMQVIAEPRTLLQGAGFVSVSVDIKQPKNGRYLLRFLVNGEERHKLLIDLMVPEQLRFDGDVNTKRFTSLQPNPPPSCTVTDAEERTSG